MSDTRERLQHIGKWLAKVRRATAAGSEEVPAELLGDYTGWLSQDFALSVFTDASAKFVAEKSPFFPKYALLQAALTDWREKHPDVPRIMSPVSEDLNRHISRLTGDDDYKREMAEMRAAVHQDWQDQRRIAETVVKIRELESTALQDQLGKWLGSAVKRHAPQNLDYLPPEWIKEAGR